MLENLTQGIRRVAMPHMLQLPEVRESLAAKRVYQHERGVQFDMELPYSIDGYLEIVAEKGIILIVHVYKDEEKKQWLMSIPFSMVIIKPVPTKRDDDDQLSEAESDATR